MFTLNDLNDAVDGKFVVTKNLSNQAPLGTLIHIMSTRKSSNEIIIEYRVTETAQDYIVTFSNIGDFNKWIRSDAFITRNYESFSKEEIQHYVKVGNRSFASFCLPILIVALAVIWVVAFTAVKAVGTSVLLGGVLSVVAAAAILVIYKKQKSSAKLKLYQKVGNNKWNVNFS